MCHSSQDIHGIFIRILCDLSQIRRHDILPHLQFYSIVIFLLINLCRSLRRTPNLIRCIKSNRMQSLQSSASVAMTQNRCLIGFCWSVVSQTIPENCYFEYGKGGQIIWKRFFFGSKTFATNIFKESSNLG